MSDIDRLVNACLMPAFLGATVPRWVHDALEDGLAGVCLYGHNLTAPGDDGPTRDRVRAIADALRSTRPDVLLALDEEGGDVTRLDYLVGSAYPGNLALGVVDDPRLTEAVAAAIGADLAGAGVNLNLAPSVDVNSDPRNPVIGVRSFGADPELAARHGAAYVRGLQGAGVGAVVKHFPGHGATTVDSHLGLPVVDVDEATFRRRELPPFATSIEAGVAAVMTSHVVFPALDDVPATLSRRVLVDLLRTELGFTGVVVTDALDMAGVRALHGLVGGAVRSLAAGADLLLLGAEDGQDQLGRIHAAVTEHLAAGTITEERLHEAAGRVEALRARLTRSSASPAPPDPEASIEVARRAVRHERLSPLTAPAVVAELRAEANMAVGDAKWSVAEALAEHGLVAEHVTVVDGGEAAGGVLARAQGRPLVLAVRDAYRSAWQPGWVAEVLAARPDAVVVAVGMPDDAALTTGPFVASHGASAVNARAVAQLLAGGRPAGPAVNGPKAGPSTSAA